MGLFLQTAILKDMNSHRAMEALRALEGRREGGGLLASDCLLRPCPDGTAVRFNETCGGYEGLARALSVQCGGVVLLGYIYDGDYWGYFLYDDGEEKDRFCPIPDYFGPVSPEEAGRCAGNARLLAEYFNIPVQQIARYLKPWTQEAEGRAYPQDQFGYEDWQLSDFMRALGFPMPEEGEGGSAFQPVRPADREAALDWQPQDRDGEDTYHFQVNLGGMLDVLSNHLYKSPDVFLRELLQNGVDAITLRQREQPDWTGGKITISLEPGRRLVFRDNGAGLTREGIHRFLAVIGQSSKTQLVNGRMPEDYIGRFGIGLLSCFMVSDSIVVHTRPAGEGQGHVWTGLPDGTYTLEPLEHCPQGTAVILTAKPGAQGYFQPEKIKDLVRYYGLALPVPVYLAGEEGRLNNIPSDFSGISRSQLLSFGQWLFEEEFLDAIPIQTPHISGVAYVLSYRTDRSVKNGHRIYLKQMLLTERGDTLLPPWAFFLRCFLNTRSLRPTASREDFYEDEELSKARQEFAGAVRDYLKCLSRENPERLQQLVGVHAQAIKAMAIWDEELFGLFIDYLPFETSEGTMTGTALKRAGEADWVDSVPKFKQLKPIFMAQGRLLICTGYTSDRELIVKLADAFRLPIEPLRDEGMEGVLEEGTAWEQRRGAALLRHAGRGLEPFDCQAQLRRFLPGDLPALYAMSDEVQFLRQVQSARESGSGIFSSALSSLLDGVEERPLATLYLNLNSPLIQRMMTMTDGRLLSSLIQVLYVQALLAGGHSLRGGELKVMNQALLELVEQMSGPETGFPQQP